MSQSILTSLRYIEFAISNVSIWSDILQQWFYEKIVFFKNQVQTQYPINHNCAEMPGMKKKTFTWCPTDIPRQRLENFI